MPDSTQQCRRERILDAAEQAFAEFGFAGASLRTMVRQAKVNLATVYYYFNSKEGLMEAVLKRRFGPLRQAQLELLAAAQPPRPGRHLAVERTVLTALEETENAMVDFNREEARRNFLAASERAATEAMTLARQRYDSGIADFLPVLDAERTQLDAQAQLAQSQTRAATTLLALYKALGGGWEIDPALALQRYP